MMKNLLLTSIVLVLAACKSGGGDSNSNSNPAQGTVLGTSCDNYTLVETIANGNGGSTTRRTPNSEQCGYEPNPPAGTVLKEGCSSDYIGVKWFRIADGEGGYYSEKDTESLECGYEEPVLQVTVGEAGDRFVPTVIEVQTYQYGEPVRPNSRIEWDFETTDSTLGVVTKTETGLEILGDSRVGDGIVLINGEEYQYSIGEEPVCEVTKAENFTATDCQGHRVSGSKRPFIYYGEEDTRIVIVDFTHWEAGWPQFVDRYPEGAEYFQIGTYGDYYARRRGEGSAVWDRGILLQDKANKQFERAGIHIRLRLVDSYESNYANLGYNFRKHMVNGEMIGSDIVGQTRTSHAGTCGVAYPATWFTSGFSPRTFLSKCGYNTWLHELGHNIGMAHGPYNSANEATGYIWPDWGHGTTTFCSYAISSIMSYGNSGKRFSNSLMSCEDYGLAEKFWDYQSVVRGTSWRDEQSSDEAYHFNRVRYNLSLIWHNAREELPVSAQPQYNFEPIDTEYDLIVD